MSRGLIKIGFILVLMLLVFGAFGCQGGPKGQSDWVVQTDTESVKPRQGVTDKLVELDNCKGYDWKDEDHLYVYRYSETVFGDDRGVASVNVNSKPLNFEFLKIQQPVTDFRVSPDGKQQVYTMDSTDKNQYLAVRDAETEKELVYKVNYLWLNEGLSWNYSGGAYLTGVSDQQSAWWLQQNGEMKVRQFSSPKPDMVPKENGVQMGLPMLTSVQGSKEMTFALFAGPQWNQIARYDGLKEQGKWLPYKNVEKIQLSPSGEKLAILQFSKDYSRKSLLLLDVQRGEISQLIQNEAIINMGWSADGSQLFYSILNKDNVTDLFIANLKTGTRSFVATYPGYGPQRITFSPSGKKLMIVFGKPTDGQSQQLVTQILTLK